MQTLKIAVILGTARAERQSEHASSFVMEYLKRVEGIEAEFIDVRDMSISQTKPSWEDHTETRGWKKIAEKVDAFFIVTPEYNHGYPGELKMFLDSAYKEYFYKPVALVGVSDGKMGGGRVLEHLKPVLIEMGMVVLKDHLYISNIDGKIEDTDGKLKKQLDVMIERLSVFARGLVPVREQLLK